MSELNRTEYPDVTTASSVLQRSLILLRAAKDKTNIDGLTAPQIAVVLTDLFRVKTTRQAVSMALGNASDKVDRDKVDSAFVYKIMASGESYLDSPPDESSETTRRKARKTKAKSTAESPPQVTSVVAKVTKNRRQTGRPGPKAMIETLINSGFFSQSRTSGEIQDHLQRSEGRRYKATELSPALLRLIREKKISRETNADGQYDYKAK